MGTGWHHLASGETWITREGSGAGAPAWLDDHRLVYAADGRYLVLADTSKQRRIIRGPLPFGIASITPPAVAPDRRTIYVGAATIEADVWLVERIK